MHYSGIIIAVIAFMSIGVFHPIVIKAQYYFSDSIWPLFLLAGLLFLAASLFAGNTVFSAALGAVACSCFWSIGELKAQTKRVEKGWFPDNPNRKNRQLQKK